MPKKEGAIEKVDQIVDNIEKLKDIVNGDGIIIETKADRSTQFREPFEDMNKQSGIDLSDDDREAYGKAGMYAAMDGTEIEGRGEMDIDDDELRKAIEEAFMERFLGKLI
tara:strand:- start:2928 stop:3257 length:330 start_codon:yes stop_codon:yes gene_type:complete